MGGRIFSAFPLYDGTNRMLVSWSPCLVLVGTATQVCNSSNTSGANVQLAPPQYTLWVYDFDAGTLSPVLSAEAGMMIVEPVILQARKPAPIAIADGTAIPGGTATIPDTVPTTPAAQTAAQNMATNGVGLLDISSVYDFDGVDTADSEHRRRVESQPGKLLSAAVPLHQNPKGRGNSRQEGAQNG